MIQRIQSIYLLIGAACGITSAFFPFLNSQAELTTLQSSLPFVGGAIGVLSLLTIFLFNNRKLQATLALVGTILGLTLLGVGFWQINTLEFTEGLEIGLSYYFWAGLPMGFWLANKAIRKDIKLVKSMDSFR